jgi:RNA polymerase sigma-70 factor, ECF subfamily
MSNMEPETANLPAKGDTSDAELMARMGAGDRTALGALYQLHRGLVLAAAAAYLPAAARAELEDVCQEVFLIVWRRAKEYDDRGKLRAWLAGIAANKARGVARRQWFRSTLLAKMTAGPEPVESAPGASAEARIEVERVMRGLPAPQRAVLLLHTVANLSTEEIAQTLDIEQRTVWTRLHRARAALRKARRREGGGEQ